MTIQDWLAYHLPTNPWLVDKPTIETSITMVRALELYGHEFFTDQDLMHVIADAQSAGADK